MHAEVYVCQKNNAHYYNLNHISSNINRKKDISILYWTFRRENWNVSCNRCSAQLTKKTSTAASFSNSQASSFVKLHDKVFFGEKTAWLLFIAFRKSSNITGSQGGRSGLRETAGLRRQWEAWRLRRARRHDWGYFFYRTKRYVSIRGGRWGNIFWLGLAIQG